MDDQLSKIVEQALARIESAGGIEGDTLKPIQTSWESTASSAIVGTLMLAGAIEERKQRGYRIDTDSATVDNTLTRMLQRADQSRDQHIDEFVQTLIKHARLNPTARQPLLYVLSELVANIWDHAEVDRGFIGARADSHSLTLAVADTGISIPLSYARRDITFPDDIAALQAALQGRSARPQGGRGYGLRTSARMAVSGWGGVFLLVSRHALVTKSPQDETAKDMSPQVWNGTLAGMNIALPLGQFDFYAFIED